MRRLCIFFCAILGGLAQEPTVRLRLGTVGNQTQFHIGQPISLTLTFQTDGTRSFPVLTVVRPRRIRPQAPDEFSAEPAAGWVDPLGDLTWTADNGFGNPQQSQGSATLDATHRVVVERSLNEFVVFRQPGHYVIHCNSSRVTSNSGAIVKSNGLALDILPRDEIETARQFAAARATLEAGKPPKEPERTFDFDKENAQSEAVRTLRYLDTEATATYLASIFGQARRTNSEMEYALLASAHREAAVRELERHVADPDLTLTQNYTSTLIELKARLQESKTGHALMRTDWNALDEAVNKRVFSLAPWKTPEAKAGTYFYLFETGSKSFRGTPEVLRLVLESLPFASAFQIEVLLNSSWRDVRGARSQLAPLLRQAVTHQWPQMNPRVSGLALLRLAELDPKSANQLAVNALLSGDFSIGDPELFDFSVPASPALDLALLAQYQQAKPVDARIARFASPEIEDALWRAYDARAGARGSPECATPLLAYFFRVDAATAAERVAEDRASGTRPCMALQFPGLQRRLMSPGLERQLIRDMKGSDPNTRLPAYRALSLGGSPAALPELLQALKQTSDSKQEIISAILQGWNWVLKDADYAELARNCAGTSTCFEITRIQRESAPPYSLHLFDSSGHQGVWLSNREVDSLADLDEKLDQYPAGATFRWQPDGAMGSAEREIRDHVQALLVNHGMTLLP